MNRTTILLGVGLALTLCATPAQSQGTPTVRPNERTAWYRMVFVKFKPGTLPEAQKLIYDHYWPVDKEIGREVIPFDPVSGEWDQIVCFPMSGSPTEIGLQESPMDKKWNETLIRREGGKAQSDAINKRYMDLVMHTKTEIVLRRLP